MIKRFQFYDATRAEEKFRVYTEIDSLRYRNVRRRVIEKLDRYDVDLFFDRLYTWINKKYGVSFIHELKQDDYLKLIRHCLDSHIDQFLSEIQQAGRKRMATEEEVISQNQEKPLISPAEKDALAYQARVRKAKKYSSWANK